MLKSKKHHHDLPWVKTPKRSRKKKFLAMGAGSALLAVVAGAFGSRDRTP